MGDAKRTGGSPSRSPDAVPPSSSRSDNLNPNLNNLDSSPSSSSPPRSLSSSFRQTGSVDYIFHHRHIRLTWSIPNAYAFVLEPLREAFLVSISSSPEGDAITTPLELALTYIEFLLTKEGTAPSLFEVVLQAFNAHFLRENTEFHCLIAEHTTSAEHRQRWIRAYYQAVEASGENYSKKELETPIRRPSAFFQNVRFNHFKVVALFGGQGDASRTCVQELSDLYDTYQSILRPLVRIIDSLFDTLCQSPQTGSFDRAHRVHLEGWLNGSEPLPAPQIISSAPISVPVIGVLSLARYCVICHVLKLTPGELRDHFEATTGHSQGLLVAIAIAMSDSWESFYDNSRRVVEKLFWLGWECHRTAPCSAIAQAPSPEGLDGAEDPSYMLSVRGIECERLESILSHVNKLLPKQSQLYVALVNCRDQFVVAGPVDSLVHLHSYLATIQCPGDDQSRVPFSRRKPSIQRAFLPISTPFHTPYLQRAAFSLKERFHDSHVSPSQLRIPVYHTRTGQDLRELNDDVNLLDIAVDAIACEQCDWSATLRNTTNPHDRETVSHAVLFDRGGLGTLVKKMTEGAGIRIIQGSELDSRDPEMGSMRDLFSSVLLDSTARLQSWGQRFQPRLVTEPTTRLETRLSRLLGTPPVLVAGMTPTTVHWDFVSTIMNAGYHVELAGGGYHTSSDMAAAIQNLAETIPPGRGITCNLIYANPRAMRWQIALLRRLTSEHVPIDGLTIGAGVPSLDVVTDYIHTLKLRHISFKPGSVTGIRQVIAIARAHPEFPIILQWTGGRGGGHHSFEDFHAPILSTYGLIRQQSNIYLVAGSGFGDGDSMYQYLTGTWSTNLGHASMPFDGALLGSRMMVAREAHTSPSVKKRIVKTPGLQNDQWEKTYLGAAGGIVTVQSEMGEPIHKIATKGVLLWAEMDKTVFSLPRKDRLSYLRANRATIIRRLNSDFAKPWFGKSKEGEVVDLEDMTYLEVLMRMVELMYIKHQRRWIDPSYIDFTMRVTVRALERLQSNNSPVSNISRRVLEDDPEHFISAFASVCPSVEDLLNPEDISWFLVETKRAGQKPVNFIPALDDDFELYFKKDSLWQSEDIDAVVNQDVERVCILHGPVAAQYSKSSKESAKEILDSIIHSLVGRIQREALPIESTSAPDSGLVTPDSWSSVSAGRDIFTEEMSLPSSMTLSDSQDDNCKSAVAAGLGDCGFAPAWARAMLGDKIILQNRVRSRNPFSDFIESYPEAAVQFDPDRSGMTVLHPVSGRATSSFRMTSSNGKDVNVEVYAPYRSTPLQLLYRIDMNSGSIRVSEIMKHRTERISSFYSKLWFGEQMNSRATMHDTFCGPKMTLTHDVLSRFLMVSGTAFGDHRVMFADSDEIPIGMGIVIAWDSLTRPLVIQGIDADLLRLVHRSNTFRYYSGATPLRVGDIVTSQSRVQAVSTDDSGKTITVEAKIIRFGKPVMAIISSFLFRGSVTRSIADFTHTKEPVWKLHLRSRLHEAILLHREWFEKCESTPSLTGQLIAFNLETHIEHKEGRYSSLHVTGNASCQLRGRDWEEVGIVDFKCSNCNGNPVLDFLKRRGTLGELHTDFDLADWTGPSSMEVKMPFSNEEYAQVSKDFNPIHVSPIFANLAQLPGTLSHGMCTSAIATMALEHLVLDGDRGRLRKFAASFTGMVYPSEVLVVQLKHTGMVEGRMKFTIDVIRKSNGENVLVAEAEVEQPPTAYLFTGQGSQSKGMGMDLYRSSPVAKALWDEIDGQLYKTYGWSVLDIVQNNPKSHTIHFGGHRGRKLKQRYLSITTQIVQPDGSRVQQCVLPGLTPESTSYTFTDSRGLLYSTQFAQPAILLFEAAVFADLRAGGYVSQNAVYAGHSLGEYGALSALAQNIPVGSLAELAFYRGLMMQASVASKDQGTATSYGMMAVNPARVGKYFNQAALDRLVHLVSSESQELLEIVNFNVDGEQYVCAGTTPNLYVLGKLLDYVAESPDGAKLVREAVDASVADDTNNTTNGLHRVIGDLLVSAKAMEQPLELQRGRATIPLQGIDVPFHSSHLRSTVDRFRECLLKPGFLEGNVDVEQLIGRYIPNLLARPFSLDEEYIKEAYELTRSPVLAEILKIV